MNLLAVGAPFILLVCFFWRPLLLGQAFFADDLSFAYLPILVENARYRAAGELPLWNPHILFGYPINAEIQFGGLYPLGLLFDLNLSPERALTVYIVAHYLVAIFGTLYFGRALGLSRVARAIAAIVFAFSGAFVAQTVNLVLITTFAFAPLILGLQYRAIVTRSARHPVFAGLVFGASLMGAHPQMSFYTGLLCLALAVGAPGEAPYRERLRHSLFSLMLILAIGVGLAFPQILYALQWRGQLAPPPIPQYSFVTQYSHPPHYLLQLLIPDLLGGAAHYAGTPNLFEQRCYWGIAALGLLVAGWRSSPRFLNAALLGSLVLALGGWTGLYRILAYVPGFSFFRCPARMLLCASLIAALMAGFGYDRVMSHSATRRGAAGFAVVAAVLGLAAVLMWTELRAGESGIVIRIYRAFLAFGFRAPSEPGADRIMQALHAARRSTMIAATVAAGCALWWTLLGRRSLPASVVGPAIVPLLAFDLWLASGSFHRFERETYYRDIPPAVQLYRDRPGLFRTISFEDDDYELSTNGSNLAALYSVDEVSGSMARKLASIVGFDLWMSRMSVSKMAAGNVRYIRSRSPLDQPELREIAHLAEGYIYENVRALPRAFLRNRYRVMAPGDLHGHINSSDFDPWTEVVLEEEPGFAPHACADPSPELGAVTIADYRARHVSLESAATGCTVLVLADMHYPGWSVSVDGQAAPLLRANGLFRGVALGAGRHHIEFHYRPRAFYGGLAVSGIVAMVALTMLLFWKRRPASPSTT